MSKLILYCLVLPLVIWSTESVNISTIFKKDRFAQARIFYLLLIFSLTYLVVNFLSDFIFHF